MRLLSAICAGAIVLNSVPAFAVSDISEIELTPENITTQYGSSENSIPDEDGYRCELKHINDSEFIVTAYLNDEVTEIDRGSFDSDTITADYYSKNKLVGTEKIKVDDVITVSDSITSKASARSILPTATNGTYAGSVTYRYTDSSGKYRYPVIAVYYSQISQGEISNYNIDAAQQKTLSTLIATIYAATGVYFGTIQLSLIIEIFGGAVKDGIVNRATKGTIINGTQCKYSTTANYALDGSSASQTYTGYKFTGTLQKASGTVLYNQTVYDGYYPQFIKEKDISIAAAMLADFCSATCYVYKWSNNM